MEPEVGKAKKPQPEAEITRKREKEIEKTVQKILKTGNLYELTERKVRDDASAQLGIDPSDDHYKTIVRRVVENFLLEVKNDRENNT